jgi:serine/threonine protein kinase
MLSFNEKSIEFEYMDYELYDLVEVGKFSENLSRFFVKELLEGLIYLEEINMVHLDFKL